MQNLNSFKGIKSSELRGFFTGLILGDGTIDKGVHKRSFSIKSIYKDFIDFIESVVKEHTTFQYNIKHTKAYTSSDGTNHKEYWEFRIKAHPYFNKLYHYFYDDHRHRKIYSKTLNWLNPIGLACWYMSDGYICLVGKNKGNIYNRRIDICTDRYYEEDVDLIIKHFKDKFDLECSKNKRNKTYRTRIKNVSYEKFIDIIKPYIVDSMKYKMYLGYTNQPKNLSDKAWEFQQSLLSAVPLTGNAEGEDIV